MVIVGVTASIVVPSWWGARERARIAEAVADIRAIEAAIAEYQFANRDLPPSLEAVGWRRLDPWGRPYEYLPFNRTDWLAKARLDRFRVPINSTYDLYTIGPDARSVPPLVLPPSWDDVVRGNDGAFVGLASRY